MRDAEDNPGEAGSRLAGVRALVVDDEEDSRFFLQVVLEDEGAEVETASSGAEGIDAARRGRFDVMTLDLEMPGKSGVDTFAELREIPELEHLPVCVVTGHPEMRALIYKQSVRAPEGFLAKPVEPDDLVLSIRRILELVRRRRG